jgi:hypothetical protein
MTADDPLTAEELAEASLAIMHREGLKPFTCEEFADGCSGAWSATPYTMVS